MYRSDAMPLADVAARQSCTTTSTSQQKIRVMTTANYNQLLSKSCPSPTAAAAADDDALCSWTTRLSEQPVDDAVMASGVATQEGDDGDDDDDSLTMSSLVTELDPRPFVRSIGHAIRLRPGRINSCKDPPLTGPATTTAPPATSGSQMLIKHGVGTTPSTSEAPEYRAADEPCRFRPSSSSWSLRLLHQSDDPQGSTSPLDAIDQRQTAADENPFGVDWRRRRPRHIFSSLRSAQQQRRRFFMLLPVARSSSNSVRPSSLSLNNLASSASTDLYLETARLKKQSVEQSLSVVAGPQQRHRSDSIIRNLAASTLELDSSSISTGSNQLDFIRHQLGCVPSYVELKRGRVHLKLVQGQYDRNKNKLAGGFGLPLSRRETTDHFRPYNRNVQWQRRRWQFVAVYFFLLLLPSAFLWPAVDKVFLRFSLFFSFYVFHNVPSNRRKVIWQLRRRRRRVH